MSNSVQELRPITDERLISILERMTLSCGKDFDGDFIEIQGHRFLVNMSTGTYKEFPRDTKFGTRIFRCDPALASAENGKEYIFFANNVEEAICIARNIIPDEFAKIAEMEECVDIPINFREFNWIA